MTADIELLLPLPEPNGSYTNPYDGDDLKNYARAKMEPLIAEIEALRAERDSFQRGGIAAQARAERLVEAISAYKAECDNPAKDYVLRAKRRDEMFALLRDHDQESGNG